MIYQCHSSRYFIAAILLAGSLMPSICHGVTFQDHASSYMPEGHGITGRAALADLNKDGWVDLCTNNSVYLSNGGTSFTFTGSENNVLGRFSLADYDNDGWIDVLGAAKGKMLLHNEGATGGTFSKVSSKLPAESKTIETQGSTFVDLNGDGYLDIYCGGYEGNDGPDPGYPDMMMTYNPTTDAFDMAWTETASFQRSPSNDPVYHITRGVTAADFDRDGDQDIYTSSYRLHTNRLWVNNPPANDPNYSEYISCGNTTFGDGGEAYGVEGRETLFYNRDQAGVFPNSSYYGHTIGSAWGDVDNDGYLDLFVGNFRHDAPTGVDGDDIDGDGDVDVQRYYQDYAHFLRNTGPDGDYHFERMTQLDGVDWQESYTSPTLGDYDNDGDLDLFFATVYSGDHARLYRNDGNWQFTDVTAEVGVGGVGGTYMGAWGDIDNDGDLDLITQGKIFISDASTNGNHWVKIKLDGDGETVNRSAIGSQVRIYLGDKILTRQVEATTGMDNQNDLTLHFGLGDYDGPIDVEIFWSDGTIQTLDNMEIDGLLSLSKSNVPGDANLDGRVDGSDVTILAAYWQRGVGMAEPDATWKMGDFNGDGIVDGSDVTILASNWQEGVTAAATAVPELSMLWLLGILLALGGLIRIRR